jgi:N-acetyl-anhydromuramyl-L-alanine amidase AmpD
VSWRIPYGAQRRAQMAAYAKRHYGTSTYTLAKPRVIVEHYTVTRTARPAYNTFASNARDPELHELPGVCAHFLVDTDGTIFQLVSTSIMCRHTVGLNYTAIGIEHVGMSDGSVMGNRRQRTASVQLTRWLRCRHEIDVKNVIGHSESLSSPYHRERVARLRRQTHGDMTRATMKRYRALVARRAC